MLNVVFGTSGDHWRRVEYRADPALDLAVLRSNIAISLEWGRRHMDGESWEEPWAAFPDSRIFGYYVDLRYNGVAVHSDLLLSVDGSRAYLPSGRPIVEQGRGTVGLQVTRLEVALARLVDEISRGATSEFDSYFSRASMELIDP